MGFFTLATAITRHSTSSIIRLYLLARIIMHSRAFSFCFVHTPHFLGRVSQAGEGWVTIIIICFTYIRDSDIRWKSGWEQCYLVEFSVQRTYFFICSVHERVFRGGGILCTTLVHHSIHFKWFASGYPISVLNVQRTVVFGEGLSDLRDGNDCSVGGGNSARGTVRFQLPSRPKNVSGHSIFRRYKKLSLRTRRRSD